MVGGTDLGVEGTDSREKNSDIDPNSTNELIMPSKSKDVDQITNSDSSGNDPRASKSNRKDGKNEYAVLGRASEGVVGDFDTPKVDGKVFTEQSVENNIQLISAGRVAELEQAISHLQYTVYVLLDENDGIKKKHKAKLSALTEEYEEKIRAKEEKNDALRRAIVTIMTKFEAEKDKIPTSICKNCISSGRPLSDARESAMSKQVSDHLDDELNGNPLHEATETANKSKHVDHDTISENFNTREPGTVSESIIVIDDIQNAVSNTTEGKHSLKRDITPIAGEIDLVISRVKLDVKGTHLREYLANIGVQVIRCQLLTTLNDATFLTYKVTITSNDVEKVKNPLIWPEGTKITPYDRARWKNNMGDTFTLRNSKKEGHLELRRTKCRYGENCRWETDCRYYHENKKKIRGKTQHNKEDPWRLQTRHRSATYSSKILQNSAITRFNKLRASSYQAWH